jgi:hypothetical protein
MLCFQHITKFIEHKTSLHIHVGDYGKNMCTEDEIKQIKLQF